MKLTHEMFEAGRSDAGGHNLKQLRALGLKDMPSRGWPAAGWPSRLIGSEVTEEQYAEFLALRKKSKGQEMGELIRSETNGKLPPGRNTLSILRIVHATMEQQLVALKAAIQKLEAEEFTVSPYDPDELKEFMAAGRIAWADIPDATKWVREQRGDSTSSAL